MMGKWYLIKNDRGSVCDPQRGGCGKVHEYLTHKCRPVAFDKPWEWSIFKKSVEEEVGLTLKSSTVTYLSSPLGTVVEIAESDLVGLNVIKNPVEELPTLSIVQSFPNFPVLRGRLSDIPQGIQIRENIRMGGLKNGR